MGLFVGYLTAQLFKSFKDAEWKKNILDQVTNSIPIFL